MKKINYIKFILLGFTAMALSSCLKDKTYVNFADGGQSAELPLSGLNSYAQDAITSDTAVISFGVNIASSSTPTADHKITVDIIPSKIADYLATNNSVPYELMPESAHTFKTTVVDIPGGQRLKILTFTIYKNKLDPSKSYMLPIGITSAPGLTISANNALHYYHVIGNDFGGTYHHAFIRTPPGGDFADNPESFIPVSNSQFQVKTGYVYTSNVSYQVTFTKTGTGASATYTNFALSINSTDTKTLTDAGITVTSPPAFVDPTFSASKAYTYADAVKLFATGLTFSVVNSSGSRVIVDKYTK